MKIVGLIAEYNPFHNGHLYHIEKAREVTGADAVIVVMSGDFVQRGAPAILPKHLRTKTALDAGADMVLELPVSYATGSAEYFATGAISLLDSLRCVDTICFGSECGDFHLLERIAHIIADEPQEYRNSLRQSLKQGMSFPHARQNALKDYLKYELPDIADSIEEILEQPNNILGIEYIKALYQNQSPIRPYTIKRKDSGYHDIHLSTTCSSASAIRNLLTSAEPSRFDCLKNQMPPSSFHILKEAYGKQYPIYSDDFSLLLKYRLMNESKETLTRYMDINEELANRIINHANEFLTFSQFSNLLKTKNINYTRISRCLLHVLLNIAKEDLLLFCQNGHCQYAHILGFRKDATDLLSCLKQNSQIPLITKLTKTDSLTTAGQQMLKQDIFASNLYESVVTEKFKFPFINEYQQQVLRV